MKISGSAALTTDDECRGRFRLDAAGDGRHGGLGLGSIIALLGLAGAAIEIAYALRAGASLAIPIFWVGQLALFGIGTYGVTRRGTSNGSAALLIVVVAVVTYMTKVSYSPIRFSYPDELQHARTLAAILNHHHLFYPNPSLPVSPSFPGLEVVTAAVMMTTGLSQFGAGLLVAGFAHVMLVVALYYVFRAIPLNASLAGLAVMVFATEPHFEYFDAIFAYQTLALPLLAMSLLGAIQLSHATARSSQARWATLSLSGAAGVLFTHHVSMLALLALLAVVAVVAARGGSWLCTLLFLICAAGTVTWFATQASGTIQYLGQPLYQNILGALPGHSTGAITHGSPSTPPRIDRALAYAGVLAILALLAIGWLRIIRSWATTSIPLRAFAISALSYPVVLCVRLFAGDSSELTGRALTFAYIAVAAVAATVLVSHSSRITGLRRLLIMGTVALLGVTGLVTGWPPWWERVPGAFQIDSFESGVDRQNIAVALWAQTYLLPNNHVATDFDTSGLIDTLGDQEAELNDSAIFYAKRFSTAIWHQIDSNEIHLFVIDRRMEFDRPAAGSYFALTPPKLADAGTVPRAGLQKFAKSSRFSRVYDSGTMSVYLLLGSRAT